MSILDELIAELKAKKKITREDIENLLASIAPAGEKHQEKIDAVKQLGKPNFQGIGVETTLETYRNF